jgi:hypothetical protein
MCFVLKPPVMDSQRLGLLRPVSPFYVNDDRRHTVTQAGDVRQRDLAVGFVDNRHNHAVDSL